MRVRSREDLIAIERAAGRSQVVVDLEQLGACYGAADIRAQRAGCAMAMITFFRDR